MTQCTHQSQNVSATRLITSDYTLSNVLIISGKMQDNLSTKAQHNHSQNVWEHSLEAKFGLTKFSGDIQC